MKTKKVRNPQAKHLALNFRNKIIVDKKTKTKGRNIRKGRIRNQQDREIKQYLP